MTQDALLFSFNGQQSPTHVNLLRFLTELGWQSTSLLEMAHFSDENLQFHIEAAQRLEYKHFLAQLMIPNHAHVMPLTYCINDDNWPYILQSIREKKETIWILKPALLNNGQHIKILANSDEVEAHFSQSKRLGGEQVLQQYISNLDLLREHHKYSIRMFVVLSNYGGNFIYPFGYFNVALHPFTLQNFTDLRPHLTNEHLQHEEDNVVQIPSERFSFFSQCYPQIKEIACKVLQELKKQYPQAFQCQEMRQIAIFGFDFMRDSDHKIWLLEANHGPCFPINDNHPLQAYLYHDFWKALIQSFIKPIATHQTPSTIKYQYFEAITDS